MIKAKKRTLAFTIIIILLILTVVSRMLIGSVGADETFAEVLIDDEVLTTLIVNTKDVYIEVNNQTVNIVNYSSYLNSRFQLENKHYDVRDIADEWILKIVPIDIFKMKRECFFIGDAYGFYINYDSDTKTYLVYLMLNHMQYKNGLFYRSIEPLYYEQYVYNEETETVALVYMDYEIYPDPEHYPTLKLHYYHYRKHSDYEKLYLKDVNFTGSLYNENHPNIDEVGYDKYKDNGGYFTESRYRFKGVSTQSGKFDFAGAVLQIGLGYIPLGTSGLSVGDVINVVTSIDELVKFAHNAVNDFRGEISNEALYKNDKFLGMLRDEQIGKFGKPIKYSATQFRTNNTKDAVLLDINNDSYARNEWLINYYDQSDMWNTRFVGNVSLDIVKEVGTIGGSRVEEIAKDISPITPCTYTINNGEETKINENEEDQLYILNDAKHRVSFTAPENGYYTIKTFGDIKNELEAQNPQYGKASSIDNGINKSLRVKLKKGEIIKLDVTKQPYSGSAYIGMDLNFTPEEIVKGESKELTIAPNEKEFFGYVSDVGMGAFNFSVVSPQTISLDILQSTLSNSKYYINGINIEGSMITNNEMYYIGITNNSAENITVVVSLEAVAEIEPTNSLELNVLDKKILILSAPYSSGISIDVDSEAPINMKLYNENNELINLTQSSEAAVIKQSIEKSKKYYLVLENYSYRLRNAKVWVSWDAYNLSLGSNSLQDVTVDEMYVYKNKKLDAQFVVSSNGNFTVYNKEFNVVAEDSEGCYTFLSEELYYLISQSQVDNCNINIQLNCTEGTGGIYSENGYKFIKYIPSRTSMYKVEGAANYVWYSEGLQLCGAYLYAGSTYYLRIEGLPSEQYDIKIVMNRNQLAIGRVTNVYSGYYYFIVEQAGEYSFRTYCSNGINSKVSLYSETGDIIINDGQPCEDLDIDITAANITLSKGGYYIDLKGNIDTARIGIHIIKK